MRKGDVVTYCLFDLPAYQDTLTSILAAESMVGKTAPLRDLVLAALKRQPMTDEQIAETLNLAPNTARPRRIELVQAGLVGQVGEAKTKSGRRAILWGAQ
jgi:predicted ArsR family transcriptional regulator